MWRVATGALAAALIATGSAAASPAPAGTARLNPPAAGSGAHLLIDAQGTAGGGFHHQEIPTGLAIVFDRGFAFDPTAVAGVCSDSDAKNDSCPANSIVGTGALDVLAEGFAFGPSGQQFTAQLTFYRANPREAGDQAGIVFSFKEVSSGFHGTSIGRLKASDDPLFGSEIRWDKLPIPSLPPGLHFTLERLRADIGAGSATPAVRVPATKKRKKHHRHHRCHHVVRRTRSGHRHRVLVCSHHHHHHHHHHTARRAHTAQAGGSGAFLTNPITCTGSWRIRLELTYASGIEQRDADAPCTQ